MALTDDVKLRLGIYYSDENKDREIEIMVNSVKLLFAGAGWDIGKKPDDAAVEAIVLYCKMAQSTDPAMLTNHPVLLSVIGQRRV